MNDLRKQIEQVIKSGGYPDTLADEIMDLLPRSESPDAQPTSEKEVLQRAVDAAPTLESDLRAGKLHSFEEAFPEDAPRTLRELAHKFLFGMSNRWTGAFGADETLQADEDELTKLLESVAAATPNAPPATQPEGDSK